MATARIDYSTNLSKAISGCPRVHWCCTTALLSGPSAAIFLSRSQGKNISVNFLRCGKRLPETDYLAGQPCCNGDTINGE